MKKNIKRIIVTLLVMGAAAAPTFASGITIHWNGPVVTSERRGPKPVEVETPRRREEVRRLPPKQERKHEKDVRRGRPHPEKQPLPPPEKGPKPVPERRR